MNVEKILRAGYFDNIRVDGIINPVYDSTGTIILPDSSFKESLDMSDEAYKHGVAHLKIILIGESNTKINFTELEHMRSDRESWGLTRLPSDKSIDRYVIAYADILILKSDYAIPYKVEANGKTEEDIEKLAKTDDTLSLMLAALNIGDWIEKNYDYNRDCINIAIVNKVYVLPLFRRCGISSCCLI